MEDEDPSERYLSESDPECMAKVATLAARCKAAGLKFVFDTNFIERAVIDMPCGNGTRQISVLWMAQLDALLSFPFEQYSFVQGLDAVWSRGDSSIESRLQLLGRSSRLNFNSAIFPGTTFDPVASEKSMTLSHPTKTAQITIGPASDAIRALLWDPNAEAPVSFRIEGLSVSGHEDAASILKRLSASLFFQVDLTRQVTVGLRPEREYFGYRPPGLFGTAHYVSLQFPAREYDEAPISLYSYARSADGMPLLQYLAYYQVLEFYFPLYSKTEAMKRARTILKDPTFRVDRDADLARLLGIAKGSGPGFGDERGQLKNTIENTVDADALRGFLSSDEALSSALSQKLPKLTTHTIPLANKALDLRASAAERIYDIRCKIVHTKAPSDDVGLEFIVPFSREATLLVHDIALVQFLAKSALVAASRPLEL